MLQCDMCDLLMSQIVCPLCLCSQLFHKQLELVLNEGGSAALLSKLSQEHRDLQLLWGLLSVHCHLRRNVIVTDLFLQVLKLSRCLADSVMWRPALAQLIRVISSADSSTNFIFKSIAVIAYLHVWVQTLARFFEVSVVAGATPSFMVCIGHLTLMHW